MRTTDRIAAAALAGASLVLVWQVPAAAWRTVTAPETGGLYGYLLTLGVLLAARLTNSPRLERVWLALFLTGMPLIYLEAGALQHAPLGIELAGLALFAALAVLGVFRSAGFLAAGILGHSLWDLWHLFVPATVTGWYALVCAVVDLALGVYVVARMVDGAWRARPSQPAPTHSTAR